jgi:hypothetical protein
MWKEDEYSSGGNAQPVQLKIRLSVFVYTPKPALVTEVADVNRLLAGAWAWTHRHVAGMKIPSKKMVLQHMCKADVRTEAIETFAEKQIAPAAWFAWNLARRPPKDILTLQTLINLPWLTSGPKRSWFRKETQHLFGCAALPVGVPPQDADDETWDVYREWAEANRARLEEAMRVRSHHGELFPIADIHETLKGEA